MPKSFNPAARLFVGLCGFVLLSSCLLPLVKSDPLPGNAVPVLTANLPLSVGKGQTGVISNAFLRTDDPDSPANVLTYTLTNLPAHGTLYKSGVSLSRGAQFTQSEIDSGLITYRHNNNFATADKFNFTVSDSPAITPLTRISVGNGGIEGNGASLVQDISADGRFIYFLSAADNLVGGDTNGDTDAFVYDRQSGQNSRVSLTSLNAQADGGNTSPGRLSADGRFVTFYSAATNLVAGDTNAKRDVFVRDRQESQTVRVSVSSAGGESNNESARSSISADGNLVVFSSYASNLTPGDINNKSDLFLHNRQTGETIILTKSFSGSVGANSDSTLPVISADGKFIVFQSQASNLVANDTNNAIDIFLYDVEIKTVSRISPDTDNFGKRTSSEAPNLDATGRWITYKAQSERVVQGNFVYVDDIYLYDRLSGQTTLVSKAPNGDRAVDDSEIPFISGDGRFVVYNSRALNLVAGDTNNRDDLFVYDRLNDQNRRITPPQGSNFAFAATISYDGRFIAYQTQDGSLVSNDTNGVSDVFLYDSGVLSATFNIQIGNITCDPFLVKFNFDDGTGTTCGTFSHALAQPVVTTSATIRFQLDASRTITFSGALTPSLKAGVILQGKTACTDSNPPVTLNGNNAPGDGLRLTGGNILRGVIVKGFQGRQIVASVLGNFSTIECSQVMR
jgi:hypothetical protein